jgi:anti-sigma regulatory factor (Ser/Thr protein kinase)
MASRTQLRHHLRPADLPAVAEVRRVLRDQLLRWGVPGLSDTAELLTSEIVTNALVHTDHGAVLTATFTGGAARRLRVEVQDFVAHRPKVRHPSDQSPSGRGLLLVEALADTWGVRPQKAGKTVWFELAADGL